MGPDTALLLALSGLLATVEALRMVLTWPRR
jgi:hypothetical protein